MQMTDDKKNKGSFSQRFKRTFKARMISGVLVMIPLVITILILQLLFSWTAGKLNPLIAWLFGESIGALYISLISIAVLIIITYLIGGLTTAMIGKKLISLAEAMILRIPIVKNIYSASKQVVDAVSLPDRAAFKAVVLVHFPHPGMLAIGFLTGTILDAGDETFYKVFIPTAPNPTTGFFELVKPDDVIITEMAIEDAFKVIMSGGILSPEKLPIKLGDKL